MRPARVVVKGWIPRASRARLHGDRAPGARVLPRDRPHRRPAVRRPAVPAQARPDEAQAAQEGARRRLGRVSPCGSSSSAAGAFAIPSLEALRRRRARGRGRSSPSPTARRARPAARRAAAQAGAPSAACRCCSRRAFARPRRRPRCARWRPSCRWWSPTARSCRSASIDIAPRGTSTCTRRCCRATARRRADPVGDRERRPGDGRHHDADRRGPRHRARCCSRARTPIGPRRRRPSWSRGSPGSAASCWSRRSPASSGGSLAARPQDPARATLAPILKKEDGRVDWSLTARAIDCRARGFHPWPGAHTHHEGRLHQAAAGARGGSRGERRAGPGAGRLRRGCRRSPAGRARGCCSRRSSPRAARRWPPGPGRRARACVPGSRLG